MIIVTTSCKDKKEAKKIIGRLLNKRLIACAEIHPVESIYWWKGKIQSASEVSVVLKTTKKSAKKVESEIEKLHSYDTPVIITVEAKSINQKSKSWLDSEIK